MKKENPTLADATAYAYGEWQIAEGDTKHADDAESASYHIGQADAFRDLFIMLSKVTNPDFDFAKFCAAKVDSDEAFIVDAGELEEDETQAELDAFWDTPTREDKEAN